MRAAFVIGLAFRVGDNASCEGDEGISAHDVGAVSALRCAGHPGDQPDPLAEGLGTGLSCFASSVHCGLGDLGGRLGPDVEGEGHRLGDRR